MDVGVRELRNDTARVIDALHAGERITLTVRGEPIAAARTELRVIRV